MRSREIGAATFLALVGLVALVASTRLPVGTVHQPGPGFFPLALAAGLLLCGGALVVRALRLEAPAAAPPASAGPPLRRGRAVATLVALFVYTFAIEALGFTVSTFLLLTFLFLVVEPMRWWIAVGSSAFTAGASHVVFKVWLGVQLPVGPWGWF